MDVMLLNQACAWLPYTAKRSRGSSSLNCECFPTNYGLVDLQYKSTSMLPQKFSYERKFCTLTTKVFPLKSFAVYGILKLFLSGKLVCMFLCVSAPRDC